MIVEGEEVRSHSGKSGLHLIDDAHPAGCACAREGRGKIALRHGNDATIALNRLDQKAGDQPGVELWIRRSISST